MGGKTVDVGRNSLDIDKSRASNRCASGMLMVNGLDIAVGLLRSVGNGAIIGCCASCPRSVVDVAVVVGDSFSGGGTLLNGIP